MPTNKSLGQHWLRDRELLEDIAACAELTSSDTVLEVGSGLGTLTSVLLGHADKVVAVEFDETLARNLPAQFPGKNLQVLHDDILTFNLSQLPKNYKVVANIPYYITAKIIQKLLTAPTPPSLIVLLVQKEVAERIVSGKRSLLSISVEVFSEASLGPEIAARFFTPPPKVNSQVLILHKREVSLVAEPEQKQFFLLVKAGFSEKRKKLRSSLAGGLHIEKSQVEELLKVAHIRRDARAEELSVADWQKLATIIHT
jgi:16S rRNA (adenine1518-N6/adenine1519-N6)-dimethyltransferase